MQDSEDEAAPAVPDAFHQALAKTSGGVDSYYKHKREQSPCENLDLDCDDETKEGLLGVRPKFAWQSRKSANWTHGRTGPWVQLECSQAELSQFL